MKVSQAVCEFFLARGAEAAFVVAGGASLHLIHSWARNPNLFVVPMHHEQAAAMAADGYWRATRKPGVAIATSGPGATNLITGIAGCFYDSIPCFFLTGQVSTSRTKGRTGTRQVGFQETPIADMVTPVTKGVFEIRRPEDLPKTLVEAYALAFEGRMGPVLIDIPDDIQRATVVPTIFATAATGHVASVAGPPMDTAAISLRVPQFDELFRLIGDSKRPVLVGGAGIGLARAEPDFESLVRSWQIPTVLTWGLASMVPSKCPGVFGLFGTHGDRAANLIVQNSDLVISIGARLDLKATGSPPSSFARSAKKIMVDIDENELEKFSHFEVNIDLKINMDAKQFIRESCGLFRKPHIDAWIQYCRATVERCGDYDRTLRVGPGLNPYEFLSNLGTGAPPEFDIFVDTGCALPWLMSSLNQITSRVRVFHDFNNTAMGWSLAATVGASVGEPLRPNLCVIGDGSLMMSLHSLTTLCGLKKDAKILLIDNSGYSMIRQTQDQWLNSDYIASSGENGLTFPVWESLAKSHGFEFANVLDFEYPHQAIDWMWQADRPVFLRAEIDPTWRVTPQVKFGRPNEDMEPLLPRDLFASLMLVEPMSASSDSQ